MKELRPGVICTVAIGAILFGLIAMADPRGGEARLYAREHVEEILTESKRDATCNDVGRIVGQSPVNCSDFGQYRVVEQPDGSYKVFSLPDGAVGAPHYLFAVAGHQAQRDTMAEFNNRQQYGQDFSAAVVEVALPQLKAKFEFQAQ